MHSNPSRNTSTPMSNTATVWPVSGRVGSGEPWAVTPCQTSTPNTNSAAAARALQPRSRSGERVDEE